MTTDENEPIKNKAKTPPKYTLKELFEKYPYDQTDEEEFDWGDPVGEEIW
ncbi:MAG: hypothetical protein FWG68_08460 [Defluviitaleaceae bacterium]|nr:hypothetical protein [Defluviitaleaceae bacterium]